jgi:prephenate dehydratase
MAKKVGYLGPPGTFGEQAALLYAPGETLVPLSSNGGVVTAVFRGEVDEGVAPIENSLEGAVNETLDALLQADGLAIKAELVVPIVHCLIAAPGTTSAGISVIMSHPQALAQCRAYIESYYPEARLEAALSTAGAVAAAVKMRGAAAIGTRRAAELSGGAVLAEGVQDADDNKTRFVVVAARDAEPTGDDKTSIAFTVAHDRPGTLMGVLSELANRQINLTRIESRPSRQDLGIYVFLIDFQGHRRDRTVAEALAAVEAKAHYFRVLGSYPRSAEAA